MIDVDELHRTIDAHLEDALFSFIALDDTDDYVRGLKEHHRSILRGALEATGKQSTTVLVRGWKIGLRARTVQVCVCHTGALAVCPNIHEIGRQVIVKTIADGLTLYIERPDAHNDFPMLAFGPCADAKRDVMLKGQEIPA